MLVMDVLLDGAGIGTVSLHPFLDSSVEVRLCRHLCLPTPGHLAVVNDSEIIPSLLGVFVVDKEGHHIELDVEVW